MEVKIDWDNAENQIRKSYQLTDQEVNECMSSFAQAKEIYNNQNNMDIPERICLVGKDGNTLHTIITQGGSPNTITIMPKKSLMRRLFIGWNAAKIITITGIFYVAYQIYNGYINS
jgi:hypothetical protein